MSKNDIYHGNRHLKKSDVQIEYTHNELMEYAKCVRNPEYFIETYVKIINVDEGLVNFIPYDYQSDIIRTSVENRFVICKLPRQAGKTTAIVGLMLHYLLFQENYAIAILAHKLAQAQEILSRIQLAYENLPKWLQQGIVEWNKRNITLENGCSIIASSTTSSAVRGGSFNLVYLDEFAFIPNNMQEKFFSSTYPTISSGKTTKVLITSTPNGLNLFYKMWRDSELGRNSYKRISVHWSDVPGRDEAWKEETIRNTSKEQFRVEFECEFVGSSNTLIHPDILRNLVWEQPVVLHGETKIYKEPEKGKSYVITVDTARGQGNDYSVFVVFDITEVPYKVCAIYRCNTIDPLLYPNIILSAADKYNKAHILVETNDIGQQVCDILHHDLEYDNLLTTSRDDRSGIQVLSGGFGGQSHMGLRTTSQTKRFGCSLLKSLVENHKLLLHCDDIIYELMRFVADNKNSYSAEDGNDDTVMCCVIFAWMTNQQFFKEMTNIDIRASLQQQKQKELEEDVIPFFISTNEDLDSSDVILSVSNDKWLAFS